MYLHYYYTWYRQKDSKGENSFPPTSLSSRSWPEEEIIPYSMDKLSWNLYRKERKWEQFTAIATSEEKKKNTHEWNTRFGERILSAYKVFFLKDYIMLLLTTCVGRELQIFMILLKKKCFASFDLKRTLTNWSLSRMMFVRSVVT